MPLNGRNTLYPLHFDGIETILDFKNKFKSGNYITTTGVIELLGLQSTIYGFGFLEYYLSGSSWIILRYTPDVCYKTSSSSVIWGKYELHIPNSSQIDDSNYLELFQKRWVKVL